VGDIKVRAENGGYNLLNCAIATVSVQPKDQPVIPSNKTGLNGFLTCFCGIVAGSLLVVAILG
jgi:hypothetical protein